MINEKIKGKRVLITGASSGIGEQLAYKVAREGAVPIFVSRSAEKLASLTSAIRKQYRVSAYYHTCDLLDHSAWQAVMEQIAADHGPVHILINNAGTGHFQYVDELPMDAYENMFRLNVLAAVQAVRFFLPIMVQHGEGHIVNIASQAGKMATPKSAGYAATKHALLAFTNSLRMEVAGKGIFVTAVNPGPVKTNFFKIADPDGTYIKAVSKYLLDAGKVAEKVVKHLYTPKREINLPFWMDVGSRLYQIAPGMMERLFSGQFNKK